MKRSYIIISLLILGTVATWAQDIKEEFNPVQTAVVSQSIAPDARAGGMGDVGAATEPDVNSQAWNAAKYPFAISKGGIALNYTPWLRQIVNDIDLAYLAGYYRLGDYQAVSASVRYFSLGEVSTSYGSEDVSTTIKPYEMAIDAAYSRMLSEKFSAAVTLRYIYSDLTGNYDDGSKPGSAFAADIAGYFNTYVNAGSRECQLSLGFGVYNLGSKINYGDDYSHFIPTTLRLGFNYTIPINEFNRISFAADANKLLVPTYPTDAQCAKELGYSTDDGQDHTAEYQIYREENYYNISAISGIFKSFSDAPNGFKEELEEIQWSVGVEYTYNDKFSLRGGYHHEADTKGGRKYFTVGAGFKMNVFSLDAGYVIATASQNPLDQTLRVSLGFDLDGIKDLINRGRRRYQSVMRVGLGYDVHQIVPYRELWLGGIKFDADFGLLGHSDADVLIHAICDALLGAACLRDIGYHFPDTDPRYKGIDSKQLLAEVVSLLKQKGYTIGNIDATICCEQPKINPRITEMQHCLAQIVGVSDNDVSIKATTTEKLGFTGRQEGISAYAIALIEKA